MSGNYNTGDIVLNDWKLLRLLGEGSYGKVFEAERQDFGATYKAAVKIITIPQSQSEIINVQTEGMDAESVTTYFRGFVEEIVQEFVLMSKLKGTANVVSYEDHQVVPHKNGIGWDIFIRMELLKPLLSHIVEHPLTNMDVVKLGIDICKALELCQVYNIVHRDIKPENIFVSELGDYKLGDFGIARTVEKTSGGLSKKGTYTYMAPEVYKGEAYNSSVDIYSLGIVMYRLLNDNRAPFLPVPPAVITPSDRENALVKCMSGEAMPAPKNADSRLAEIILKACAYNPKDRYNSPVQMKQDLEAILHGLVPVSCYERNVVLQKSADKAVLETGQNDLTESIFTRQPMPGEEAFVMQTDLEKTPQIFAHTSDIELPKKKNKVSLALLMLAVILLVGGAVFALFMFNRQNSSDYKGLANGKLTVNREASENHRLQRLDIISPKLEFDVTELEIVAGEERQLNLLNAIENVVWSSSDENVATVDKAGLVTAVGVGEATIKAAFDDDNQVECRVVVKAKQSAPVTVTETAPKEIAVSSISLDKTSEVILKGDVVELTANVQPTDANNKDIVWSSSNSGIATVERIGANKARIIMNSSGRVNITASYGDKSAACEITCLLPIPDLYIHSNYNDFKVGDVEYISVHTTKRDYNFREEFHESAYYSLEVISNNPSCVRIDGNRYLQDGRYLTSLNKFQFTCLSSGTATITAKWGSQTATYTIRVTN